MKFAKLHVFCLLLLFTQINFSQENHAKIRASVENRDYQSAIAELETLEKSDKKLFELNNYDYLLGRLHEKNGDLAQAAAVFHVVSARNSILKEYALWHLSQIARASGNLMLERVYLNRISVFAPESLLKDAISARIARSFFESKNYDLVVGQLFVVSGKKANSNDQRATKDNDLTRENQLLLAQAYLQIGKTGEAREIFTKLADNLSNPAQPDDFALAAARVLDEMDGGSENFGKTAPQLTENDHLKRAAIYHFNRDFAFARLHFEAVVTRFPESPSVAYALYQIGRTHAQESNFASAIEFFERVQAQFPSDLIARDALNQTASAYARLNKSTESVSRYKKFIEKYADADNLERAYLNIIDVLRDAGEDTEVLNWTVKTQETFRGKLPEALALFAQARIRVAQNDWQNAFNDLNKLLTLSDLGGTRVPGGTNKAEVTFLKGFTLEQQQKFSEAIDVYLSIPDGRGEYYGWRATERLRGLGSDEKTARFVETKLTELRAIGGINSPDEQRKNYQTQYRLINGATLFNKDANFYLGKIGASYMSLPDYNYVKTLSFFDRAGQCFRPEPSGTGARAEGWEKNYYGRCDLRRENRPVAPKRTGHFVFAEELIFLGLYDEAAPELAVALGAKDSFTNLGKEDASSLAIAFKRGEMANFAVAFIEPLWKKVPADYQIELMPREQVELLYPAPYADSLLKHAGDRNLDPRFILSIMRQESRYRADVKSSAAARGLMQFIPSTSEKIAGELGKSNFKQDALYDPPTAILFGSQYLSNLFRQFPGEGQAVAASYNAGEDNMARWLARSKSNDADRYVAEIVFSQTKDYAYKVMANYRVYQMLYDGNLKAK